MTTPENLWSTYAELFSAANLEAWGELWQEDGRFTVAYPIVAGASTLNGKAEIVKSVGNLARIVRSSTISDWTIFQTNQPETFFVEYTLTIQGRPRDPYVSPIVAKVTLKDGKIAEVLEYYDSLAYKRFLTQMGLL